MEQIPLKKMKRDQLIELLYDQQLIIENQSNRIKELESQLADRTIRMQEAGSIAEAALSLNHIFEAAQAAADQYLASLQALEVRGKEDE